MAKASKEEQRKAPILRFKGFTDDWEQRKLSEMTQQVKRTSDSENPILTISAKNGWMDQKDRFNRIIAGKELKNYIELYKNELSYNHGNSKYAKFGIIYVQRKYEKALVPKVYHSFSMSYGDPRFIENLSLGHKLDKELSKFITSGARQDGLLNINKKSFYAIKLFIPSEQEQIKISNIMDVINHIITLYERKLKLLSQVKKYFLDNLFAEKEYPNLRFKGFTDAWEQREFGSVVLFIRNGITIKQNGNFGKPITRIESISEGKLNLNKVGYADIINDMYKDYYLKNNDILFSNINSLDHIGKTAFVHDLTQDVIHGMNLLNIRVDKKCLDSKFIYYQLAIIKNKNLFKKIAKPAVNQASIAVSELKKLFIKTTSIKEQYKIQNLLSILESILTLYENKQQHLTEIKNTLLNTMFI